MRRCAVREPVLVFADHASTDAPQCSTFVQRDVRRFIAFDFVLRIVLARVVDMAFVVHVFGVDLDDFAPHPPCFRIPADMIADV
jgi:hypothetical protein